MYPQIPVHSGATTALVVPYKIDPPIHGKDGFNDVSFEEEPDTSKLSSESATDAIRRIVSAYPSKNILRTFGPKLIVVIPQTKSP